MVPNLISEGDTLIALVTGGNSCKISGGLVSRDFPSGYASQTGFYPTINNEINGLTSGGEGNRTTVDFIEFFTTKNQGIVIGQDPALPFSHKTIATRMNNVLQMTQSSVSRIMLFFILCLMTSFAFGQKSGIISGKIIDKANGETLIGATVQLEGTEIGSVTDFEGNFKLTADPGSYVLVVRYFGYETANISVDVKEGEISYVEHAMGEAEALALQQVVVVATADRSSDVVMNIELKNAAYIASGITSSEIRKTPDRTVGDILKRVTGASIQDGKFVIIRGMNDRYNAGYLDGALLSSTESDRKAFAFDVVPANLIDNLVILKTGSPDLIGDFGGGVIKINTKAVPDRMTQNISIGAQFNSLTTFKEFDQFKIYPGEKLNFISSERDLPVFEEGAMKLSSNYPSEEEKKRVGDISKEFNNDWSSTHTNAGLSPRIAYSIGFPIQLKNAGKLGVIMALNYTSTRRIANSAVNSFDGSGQVSGFYDRSSLLNVNSGGIFNLNYVGSHTQVNFRNLLNITSDFNSIIRTGTGNFSDALTVQNTASIINYNRLYNGILSVKQLVGDSLFLVNASLSYSNVRRELPDYRIASYTKTPDFPEYRLAIGDFFNSSSGRFVSNLNENLYCGNFDLSKKFGSRNLRTEIKAGLFYQSRDRDFSGRSFVYNGYPDELTVDPAIDLGQNNIDGTRLYLVEKTSDDLAYYRGKSILNAYYLAADQTFFRKLRAVYGVRFENIDIKVDNQKINTSIAAIEQNSILPSANLTYSLSEKTNLRGSYFASVNRPEFRELAPFSFFVFDKNAEIRGNPELEIATLNNFDLKYEFYPKGGELISIGGFYKNISHPIELSLDVTQPFTTFTYQNEQSATIYGLELELKKRFDFIRPTGFFKDLAIYGNLALIKSELTFNEGSQARQDRPLQGQSPYIINARLQYENPDNGWSWNVSLNTIGRRIAFVGVDPTFGDTRQDIYEAPRTVIDMQVGKTFNNITLKLTLGDLLHNDFIYYQDGDQDGKYTSPADPGSGDRLMYKTSVGYTTTVSLSYSF